MKGQRVKKGETNLILVKKERKTESQIISTYKNVSPRLMVFESEFPTKEILHLQEIGLF